MSNTSLLGSFGAQDNSSLMFRNVLVNGCFRVWQRATSQTSSGYGSADRWSNQNANSTKTTSRQVFTLGQTDVPGNPQYFIRTAVSSVANPGSLVLMQQSIEGVQTLAGQTATLSFWAKADAPKNMAIEFEQFFGTGGSPSSSVLGIGVTTIALTTSWRYYTVTANIPSISGKTLGSDNNDCLRATFWFDAGSNFNSRTNSLGQQSGTFDIAMVQMEAGPVATPFERRPIGVELQMCQRYYWTWLSPDEQTTLGYSTLGVFAAETSTVGHMVVPLPVTMRVVPNGLVSGSWEWSGGTSGITISAETVGTTRNSLGINVSFTGNTSGKAGYVRRAAFSGNVAASAEL